MKLSKRKKSNLNFKNISEGIKKTQRITLNCTKCLLASNKRHTVYHSKSEEIIICILLTSPIFIIWAQKRK